MVSSREPVRSCWSCSWCSCRARRARRRRVEMTWSSSGRRRWSPAARAAGRSRRPTSRSPRSPKMSASGFPEISSTAVMKSSARTNTIADRGGNRTPGEPRPAVSRPGPTLASGRVVAWRRSVAGASAAAEISRRSVSPRRRHVRPIRCTGCLRLRPPDRPRLAPTMRPATTAVTAGPGTPQLAQQGRRLRGADHDLLDGFVTTLDRLGHEGRRHGGGGGTDRHADDGPLDPEGGRDDGSDHGTGSRGQDLANRELHARAV